MNYDEKYMRRAIQLARNGMMFASPNPMVGAVIVHDDKIIGEGYHRRCGEGHAEVNAVASVTQPELLPHSTIYVTLEPCSHYGKTPPCAQLIIDKKIPRVVIGILDPFEKVSGRGARMLQEAGCEVTHGILEEECLQLNVPFITAHTMRRPFITLKWAQSQDRFIDRIRTVDTPSAALFSNQQSSTLVHKMRATHDAIMIGSGTASNDNPSLNCRHWHGRNPIRIILDRSGKTPSSSTVFSDSSQPTIYITATTRNDLPLHVEQIIVDINCLLKDVMYILYKKNITSVLIEGGGALLQSAINENIWDCARIETNPKSLGKSGSVKAPIIENKADKTIYLGKNKVDFLFNNPLLLVKNI